MNDNDKFSDTTDEELLNRAKKLVSVYEEISPTLSDLLSRWSRTKRELQTINKEIEKRKLNA